MVGTMVLQKNDKNEIKTRNLFGHLCSYEAILNYVDLVV